MTTAPGPGSRLAARAAALLLLGVTVVVGCRIADTDAVTPVPQLLAFLPWLLVPTLLGLLPTLLARRWPGLVRGAALLPALGWFVEPYGSGAEPAGRTAGRPAPTASVFGTQIDHVPVSRDFSATGARFLRLSDTDHRALVVDITLHQHKP